MNTLRIITLLWLSFPALAQMQPFALQDVKLTGGAFKNAQDVDLKYILALNPDKLLAPYLIDAGLPLKAERYGNWESSGLDGHIGGHYLSALAMMYASTGNAELKNRLDYMISELARCQVKNGNGYVGGIPQGKLFWERIHKGDIDGSSFGLNNTWVPLYNIHKLFAGLRDAYEYAGNQRAKHVLIGLGDWFIDLINPLSDDQIQQVLRTEHGGINETFADLYILTKNKKYLETAQKLSHRALLNPLLEKQDKLTGLHANTQIPKVIGYEKIAMLTGNTDWSDAAQYFWQNVSQKRSVAFGGNSVREHFNPTNDFSQMLRSNQGPETCNSFNMLRLSKALFLDKADPGYLDFYERTLYNHILSTQHPEKGGFVYFTPIRPNHYRVYSQPETSMWCCDKLTVRFTTSTQLEYLPDGSNWAAFMHGPIVLAAKTSTNDLTGLFADDSRMGHETKGKRYPLDNAYALIGNEGTYRSKIKPIEGLTFRLDSLTLQPFYEIHDARYQMYFQTFTPVAYNEQKVRLKQQEAEALAIEAKTIDKVNCGEQQPEVDHAYKGEKSESGYEDERFWRRTRSFISYELQNRNRAGKFLAISALDDIKPEQVSFVINDKPAEILSANGKIIHLKMGDDEVVRLKIMATNGANTSRFNQIRILTY